MSCMETKVLLLSHGWAERKTNGSAVRHDQHTGEAYGFGSHALGDEAFEVWIDRAIFR